MPLQFGCRYYYHDYIAKENGRHQAAPEEVEHGLPIHGPAWCAVPEWCRLNPGTALHLKCWAQL